MPEKMSLYWPFCGNGMDSFGEQGAPAYRVMREPCAGEVLTRVDAVTVCASDVKMIRLGNAYPLFKDRDFDREPAVLGHEVSLTVVQPAPDMAKRWPVGTRVCVQPDVYLRGQRFCIGVNVEGGMAEYMMLEREVFISDHGCVAFKVPETCSYAEIAQLEPIACVEASFRDWTRDSFRQDGSLLVILAAEDSEDYQLDQSLSHQQVVILDLAGSIGEFTELNGLQNLTIVRNLEEAYALRDKEGFDDLLIIGNPPIDTLRHAVDWLAPGGLFCWLPWQKPDAMVIADIAKVHYNRIAWRGSNMKRLSVALNGDNVRNTYQPGGKLLLMGGAGSMGRIHTLRALQAEDGPSEIVVTSLTQGRLDLLVESFDDIAGRRGITLHTLATQVRPDWEELLYLFGGLDGFSDIIICAPGAEPAQQAVHFLAKEGRIVYFSGTSFGQTAAIPLGNVAWYGATISASSGSTAKDQMKVLEMIQAGRLNPNTNVAAIVGMNAVKEAIQAVWDSRFAGKVVVYPQLTELPLTPLEDLASISYELADYVKQNAWCRQAEKLLYKAYYKED